MLKEISLRDTTKRNWKPTVLTSTGSEVFPDDGNDSDRMMVDDDNGPPQTPTRKRQRSRRRKLSPRTAHDFSFNDQPTTSTSSPQAAAGNSVQPLGSTGAPSPDPAAALSSGDQATLEQVQSTVKDVKIDMDGDLVKAYVIFDYHGKDLSLELDGHLTSDNGYIKFEPVAGKLGSLPLPQSTLQAAVDKMMASPENRDKLKLPADISDIQIQDGQAVVKYK